MADLGWVWAGESGWVNLSQARHIHWHRPEGRLSRELVIRYPHGAQLTLPAADDEIVMHNIKVMAGSEGDNA